MLDRLIDLITDFIGLFQIYTFIDEYERGVVLRFGRYNGMNLTGTELCLNMLSVSMW